MEPGVQTPEETLCSAPVRAAIRPGSWFRSQKFGLAARFVSGYLIQLVPIGRRPTARRAAGARFLRPPRLVRVLRSGAGWIGLDPTSGLLAPRVTFRSLRERARCGCANRGRSRTGRERVRVRNEREALDDQPRVTMPYSPVPAEDPA
jgi:transglutaminase-like putative cysteine protease